MRITRQLALFPLHTVLFPGVPLPLHVFEERYKLLVKRCLEGDRALGIVLIQSGSEVGAPAVPYSVGTLARIIRAENRNDGTLNLMTVGERRFRIESIDRSQPYAIGDVELLEEEPPDSVDRLTPVVRERFTRYVQSLRRLARQRQAENAVTIPDSARELSYLVAANLQISRSDQQQLLEDPLASRLRHESALLQRELTMIERLGAVTTRRVLAPGELSRN